MSETCTYVLETEGIDDKILIMGMAGFRTSTSILTGKEEIKMNKTGKILIVLSSVLSLVLIGSSAFAQAQFFTEPFAPAPVRSETPTAETVCEYRLGAFNTFEASWLIGHQVTDTYGGYLGQISSLVIDHTNGRIALVVLSDVPNLGNKPLAIPFSSITRVGENTFEFNPGEMMIGVASPGYSDPYVYAVTRGPGQSDFYGMPSAITPAWVADIYTHYGQEPYWTKMGEQPLKDLELYQSTRLMGARVQTANGEEAGMVNDLVIDSPDGHVVFIVLSDIAGRSDLFVAVPFGDLSKTGDNMFMVNTTRDKVASAPSFDESADLGSLKFAQDDYRYFGLHPCWTESE